MKQSGQIVLFQFPNATLREGKLRPALLIGKVPGEYDDWLLCMISTQIRHHVDGFDEIIDQNDIDFDDSGLKTTSILRIGRLAVVSGDVLLGTIGQISVKRFNRIKKNLADCILGG